MIRKRLFAKTSSTASTITVKLPSCANAAKTFRFWRTIFSNCNAVSTVPPGNAGSDAIRFLLSLPYPGNIRELVVERTPLVCCKNRLTRRLRTQYDASGSLPPSAHVATDETAWQGQTLEEMERCAIIEALRRTEGNLSQTALLLGISRGALYRRMEKYQIEG
ncbi:MAG: helix-turn-helix domain-containing protein [Prevotellamassilia sp.]